jgi:hypothetical protein
MRWATVGCGCGAVLAFASIAQAADADGSSVGWLGAFHPEAAARLTYGPLSSMASAFPLASGGIGARVGLSYLGLYGGLSYMDYFSEGSCLDSTGLSCGSTHGRSFGLEGGYSRIYFRMLMVRAQLGIGDYLMTSESTSMAVCPDIACSTAMTVSSQSSTNSIYLQPEILLALTLGPVLLGPDASLFYMPNPAIWDGTGRSFAAFMLGLQLGIRL